jgi:hypothetical protein
MSNLLSHTVLLFGLLDHSSRTILQNFFGFRKIKRDNNYTSNNDWVIAKYNYMSIISLKNPFEAFFTKTNFRLQSKS